MISFMISDVPAKMRMTRASVYRRLTRYSSIYPLRRHRRKLSGPLLDRMDLLVTVGRPGDSELRAPPLTTSCASAERVVEARARQAHRLGGWGVLTNGEMDGRLLARTVRLQERAESTLSRAYLSGTLSARGRHRVLRVARTIADLGGRELVTQDDVLLALGLRRAGLEEFAQEAA